MAFFKRKTPVFEAVQWRGENLDEVKAFVGPMAFLMPSATSDGLPLNLCIRLEDGYAPVALGEWIYDAGGEFATKSDDAIRNSYEQVSQ